jgi:NhaP-type Na+/H+ or K+/H+ antiporter
MNPYLFLIGISVLVVLSYLFNLVAKRIRVPSVLLLIGTGVLLNIGLRYLNEQAGMGLPLEAFYRSDLLSILGQVGIIMIVMEGALDLHLSKERRPLIIKASLAALIILIISVVAIALVIQELHAVSFHKGLVYALPLSVMSSAIIIPSVEGLNSEKREFMIYESTLSDILGIMLFNFVAITHVNGPLNMAKTIGLDLLVTLLVSAVFAYGLVILLNFIRTQVKLFLVIAILTLLYATGKMMHYSSLLIIFLFGLILNNLHTFFQGRLNKILHPENAKPLVRDFKMITMESAFLVRTFFFVVFGMSIDLAVLGEPDVLLVGSLIVVILYLVRLLNLSLIQRTSIFPELFLAPRGLVTILLFYMIPASLMIPAFGRGIMFFVIIATSVIMSLGLMFDRLKTHRVHQVHDFELGAEPVTMQGTLGNDFPRGSFNTDALPPEPFEEAGFQAPGTSDADGSATPSSGTDSEEQPPQRSS